jgi:hypothetical protein
MCKELTEEINRGEQAIKALALHLIEMGAESMTRTVEIDGIAVTVNARAWEIAPPKLIGD